MVSATVAVVILLIMGIILYVWGPFFKSNPSPVSLSPEQRRAEIRGIVQTTAAVSDAQRVSVSKVLDAKASAASLQAKKSATNSVIAE